MNTPWTMRWPSWLLTAAALTCLAAEKGATESLANQADAVVVGEVQSGRQNGNTVAFVLSVSRVIKGDVVSGTSISVRWERAWPNRNADLSGLYGLWFLVKGTAGAWALLPVQQGRVSFERAYFPLSRGNAPEGVAPAPMATGERIAAELASAIEHYQDIRELRDLAYGLLRVGDTPVTIALYRKLSANRDPELRFIGLTGLVRANDASALAELVKNVEAIANLKTPEFPVAAIQSLRDDSAAKVQALGKFASSPNTTLQRSAAEVLRDIHTRETVPFLGQLLDSPDQKAREAAMMGLSRFVDNLPMGTAENIRTLKGLQPQGPQPYRTPDTDRYSLSRKWLDPKEETPYLQFWKLWWTRVKVEFLTRSQ